MSSKTLNLYLGSLKENWQNYCDKRGLKSGEELRNYIEGRLKEKSESNNLEPIVKQKLDSVDEGKKRRKAFYNV